MSIDFAPIWRERIQLEITFVALLWVLIMNVFPDKQQCWRCFYAYCIVVNIDFVYMYFQRSPMLTSLSTMLGSCAVQKCWLKMALRCNLEWTIWVSCQFSDPTRIKTSYICEIDTNSTVLFCSVLFSSCSILHFWCMYVSSEQTLGMCSMQHKKWICCHLALDEYCNSVLLCVCVRGGCGLFVCLCAFSCLFVSVLAESCIKKKFTFFYTTWWCVLFLKWINIKTKDENFPCYRSFLLTILLASIVEGSVFSCYTLYVFFCWHYCNWK